MASLTVRNIPEDANHRFRQVAAAHGHSMEEHLRQLVVDAAGEPIASTVADKRASFQSEPSAEQWIHELVRRANGASEGIFDVGQYAEIRFMSAKDAMAELRRLADGVGLDLPPRRSARLEAPDL